VIWKIENGIAWSNAATSLRLTMKTADRRLDAISKRFADHGRGGAFWVDFDATPGDLETRLKQRRFRCRKYFPGMACELAQLPSMQSPENIGIQQVKDYSIFSVHPHPVWGPITTPIRKHELGRLKYMAQKRPAQVFDFAAFGGGVPLGACTLFLSPYAAGFHDVGVIEHARGRGIASALMAHVLGFARDRGSKHAVLISSGMGFTMYQRAGFREVCRIGFWYRQ
jgi:hypothetical protein